MITKWERTEYVLFSRYVWVVKGQNVVLHGSAFSLSGAKRKMNRAAMRVARIEN